MFSCWLVYKNDIFLVVCDIFWLIWLKVCQIICWLMVGWLVENFYNFLLKKMWPKTTFKPQPCLLIDSLVTHFLDKKILLHQKKNRRGRPR